MTSRKLSVSVQDTLKRGESQMWSKQFKLAQLSQWSDKYFNYALALQLYSSFKKASTKEGRGEWKVKIKDLAAKDFDKIDKFYVQQQEEINKNYKKFLKEPHTKANQTVIASISEEIYKLQYYRSINVLALNRICDKYDREGKLKFTKALRASIECMPFFSSNVLSNISGAMNRLLGLKSDEDDEEEDTTMLKDVEVVTINKQDLDFRKLERHRFYKFWVPIVQNALSQPISVPVIVATGHEGPVFGLTSAIHGNEINGIPMIHKLFNELDVNELRGTVVAIPVTNPQGYLLKKREFGDGQDLNRVMPGISTGNCSAQFNFRILHGLIDQVDYLLDLHTASFGRQNSLYVRVDMNNETERQMALMLRPQIIVHNTGLDRSLRGVISNGKRSSVTVEIGNPQVFQENFINRAKNGVINTLGLLKMLSPERPLPAPTQDNMPTICTKSYWLYTDVGGILEVFPAPNTWVTKGQKIAKVRDIFGNSIKTYRAPEDGIVVGRNVNPVNQTGDRIIHLGIIGGDFAKVFVGNTFYNGGESVKGTNT